MASKSFGGANLSDIARSVKERPEPSALRQAGAARVRCAGGGAGARRGGRTPALERENIFLGGSEAGAALEVSQPTEAWYTRERCQDLIDSIAKDGQQEPALARKLTGRSELRLRAHLRDAPAVRLRAARQEAQAPGHRGGRCACGGADAHRERRPPGHHADGAGAVVLRSQIEAKIFATQEALAEAIGLSKGQVAKMLKAAELMRHPTLARFSRDKSAVPVDAGLQARDAHGAAWGQGGHPAGGAEPGARRGGQGAGRR